MIRSSPSPSVAGRAWPIPRRADGPLGFALVFGRRLGAAGSGMNPLALNAIAQAIQTQEGYAPGTLAYRNNNPGNLVFAGQPGATPGAGGFAAFASYGDGYNALVNQINLDAVRGTDVNGNPTTTVGELIASWAPASDPRNNTPAYVSSVAGQTGYSPSDNLLSLGSTDSAIPAALDNSQPLTGEVLTDPVPADFSAVDLSAVDGSGGVSPLVWLGAGIVAVFLLRR